MTQETPQVEPASTPEPKAGQQLSNAWKSLSKNARIAIVVVSVFLVILLSSAGNSNSPSSTTVTIDTTPTTLSVSDQYIAWKDEFVPVISQMQAHYTQTQADLNNADLAASTQDFATLAQDATNIASLAHSPDANINRGVLDLAASIQEVASSGLSALSSNDLTSFYAALEHYGRATTQLTDYINTANSIY